MDIEQIRDYCLQKPGATEDQAFGPDGLLFRVNGKIFAYLNLERPDCVTLKCQPDHTIALRDRYHGISGAWHWNKRHWNDVRLDADVPADVILSLVDHSYEEVVRGLPKKTLFRFTEMPPSWWHTHLPTTDSLMNDLQRPPYADHPSEVVLLTTDHQQAGRGQRGTTWESEERKNLLFGLRFRPMNLKAEHSFRISQAVALAVADAVAECVKGCPVSIKWPNDIYCGDRKVCGMLLEHDLCGTEITATPRNLHGRCAQPRFAAANPRTGNRPRRPAPKIRQTLCASLRGFAPKRLCFPANTILAQTLPQGHPGSLHRCPRHFHRHHPRCGCRRPIAAAR